MTIFPQFTKRLVVLKQCPLAIKVLPKPILLARLPLFHINIYRSLFQTGVECFHRRDEGSQTRGDINPTPTVRFFSTFLKSIPILFLLVQDGWGLCEQNPWPQAGPLFSQNSHVTQLWLLELPAPSEKQDLCQI